MKFLRLDDFLDNERHGMCLLLEPQGMLFAEVEMSTFCFFFREICQFRLPALRAAVQPSIQGTEGVII